MLILPIYTIKSIDNLSLIAVKGRIGNCKGYFILDTGAQISIISNHVDDFDYDLINQSNYDTKIIGVNETDPVEANLILVNEIILSRYKLELGPAMVLPLQHVRERIKKRYPVLGIIGHPFFEHYEAMINYSDKTLCLTLQP